MDIDPKYKPMIAADNRNMAGVEDASLPTRNSVVVGDIHGVAEPLRQIIDQTQDTGCTLVFVGDLIDRGPEGCQVMEMIRGLMADPSGHGYRTVVTLRGNHEDMLMKSRHDHTWRECWLVNGGQPEDQAWLDRNQGWGWLESFPLVYEHPRPVLFDDRPRRLLVSHASLNPKRDLDDQEEEDLLWNRKVAGFGQDTVCVHGHTPQRNGQPALKETRTGPVLMVDTGAVFTGCLTGMCFTEVGEE